MNLASLASCALVLCCPAFAQALIVPVHEVRTISCYAGTQTEFDSGVPGVPFQAYVAIPSSSGAAQDSTIGDTFLDIEVNQSASGPQGSQVGAVSLFDLTFTLTTKSEYSFAGTYSGYDNGYAQAFFYKDGGAVYYVAEYGIIAGAYSIDYSGVLDPGVYHIEVETYGGGGYSSAAYDLDVEFTALAGTYCPGAPNSVGSGAGLGSSGSQSLVANDFALEGSGAPSGSFSLFIYGDTQSTTPIGNGALCIAQPQYRLNRPIRTDAAGRISLSLDFTTGPLSSGPSAVVAGSTWNFQWIYRDSVGAGFNLSNGLWVTFYP